MLPRYIAPTIGMNLSCRVAGSGFPAAEALSQSQLFHMLIANRDVAAAIFVAAAAVQLLSCKSPPQHKRYETHAW